MKWNIMIGCDTIGLVKTTDTNITLADRKHSQDFSQHYVKVFSKLAEKDPTVKLMECYFNLLHFNKGSVDLSIIMLLPEYPF